MKYCELIKEYSKGKSEAVMWAATKKVSEFLDAAKEVHPEEYWKLMKETYAIMAGEHYNELFGMWRIEQMHYKDKNGTVHHAPHWSKGQYAEVYEQVKGKLKNGAYNCWDLAVTLEMLYSDNIVMYRGWWPSATEAELEGKVVEAAVNYLNDDDDMDGKIWERFENK